MRDAIPRASWAIGAAEFPGELVEILARLVVPLLQGDLEGGLVAGSLGQLPGGGLDDRKELGVAVVAGQGVVDVLASPAVPHEAGLAELGEVAGDARLAHAE